MGKMLNTPAFHQHSLECSTDHRQNHAIVWTAEYTKIKFQLQPFQTYYCLLLGGLNDTILFEKSLSDAPP